jgi:uncharacterized membrane protein YoaK (UPF0700 family)
MLALVAALIAVTAMACQYALLRLALPNAISTAVMTGNLTNTVLSIMDAISRGHPLMSADVPLWRFPRWANGLGRRLRHSQRSWSLGR